MNYMSNNKIRVGITSGDINGIGCEVIIKSLSDNRICEMFTPVIYGSGKVLAFHRRYINCDQLVYNQVKSADDVRDGKINMINCIDDAVRVELGQSTEAAGEASLIALEMATADLERGAIDVLVTAPINKKNIQSEKFHFNGHTEYIADKFGGEPLMIMVNDVMRVGLVTVHEPISKVASLISKDLIISKLKLFRESLIKDFVIHEPKIAVLSLNPHAGDGGLLGSEEIDVIQPAIKEAYDNGILTFGPFAADGFFSSGAFAKYDGVLAMYHDQGLIPFKSMSSSVSVNYTAGLPIVRTSPAHGVGYDIAGKDRADESSMRSAIYMAIDILRNREQHLIITANPLRKCRIESGPDVSASDLMEENGEN
jgi:4-hydroxythreonine-4-phosphate dehydrogenase